MAEKEGKNINTALKGVLASDSTLIGLVDGNVRQIETDKSGGLMTFDKGVSKSDINVESGVTGFNPVGEVKQGDKRAVRGENVYFSTALANEIGIEKYGVGNNVVNDIYASDFSNSNVWGLGFFNATGEVVNNSAWYHTIRYYPIVKGTYRLNIYNTVSTNSVIYDKDKNPIQYINSTASDVTKLITVEQDGFIRFSKSVIRQNEKNSFITNQNYDTGIITNKVFALREDIEKSFNPKKLNIYPIDNNLNLLHNFATKDINDTDFFIKGYIREDGTIALDNNFVTNRNFEKVAGGKFYLKNWFVGNAKVLFYNDKFEIIQVITNPDDATGVFDGEITINKDAMWCKASFRAGRFPDEQQNIMLRSIDENYWPVNRDRGILYSLDNSNLETPPNSKAVVDSYIRYDDYNNYNKAKYPIVSFVADDLHIENKSWYIPLLNQNFIKGSFAYITTFWNDADMKDSYFTKEDVIELHKQGHDILSHSRLHAADLNKQSEEHIIRELLGSKLDLAELGINARGYISPRGERDARFDEILRRYYDFNCITSSADSANQPPIDRLFLKRFPFDGLTFEGRPKLDVIKERIDQCYNDGSWLIIVTHPQYSENKTDSRRLEFQEMIDYIRSKEINILPLTTAYDYYKNKVQKGDIRIDAERIIGMNGVKYTP